MLNYKDQKEFLNQVIEAINKGQLVLFVGSGLSKLCGLPLWKELADSLLKYCASDSNCNFSYKQLNEISNYIDDERALISIGKNILRKTYKSDDVFNSFFYKKLHVDARKNKQGTEIQKLLFGLSKIIFTTNADDILDKDLNKENVIVEKNKIGNYKSDFEHKVIHIHGSIKKPSDLVFTTADYLERYASNIFREAIKSLFSFDSKYTILFIGYGFREMQLLDFLVNVESRDSRRNKTFALNGYYSNQDDIFEVESEYYREYGVTLVSYSKDDKNYYGLVDALEYIQNEAKKKSLSQYNFINKLNKYIEDGPNKDSIRKIRNEIKFLAEQDKVFFLEKISKSGKSKEWAEQIISDKGLKKEIFSLNNLIAPDKSRQDKGKSIGTPFPGLSLLVNIDCYGTKTKEFYLEFISNIENAYLKNNDLYLNQYAYKSFLKLLFSHTDFLLENKTLNFLNSFIKFSPEPSIWMLFASFNNKVLKSLQDNKPFKFFDLMIKTLEKTRQVTYDFIEFDKSYLKFYTTNFAKNIIDYLMPIESEAFSEKRYSYDAYVVSLSQNYDLVDAHTYLKKWLGNSIRYLMDEEAIELYKTLSKSDDTFSRLTSIYIANVHFFKVGQLFIDDIQQFSSDRIYFSEIYSALKNNIQRLNSQQINSIISFINNLKYDNKYITVFCKLDLLQILQSSCLSNNDILSKINELNNFLTMNHAKIEYKKMVPLDRSKSFFISVSWERDEDSKLKNKILAMNLDEFISHLKANNSTETKFSVYQISNFFDALNSKFNLFNKSTLSKFNGVSNEFLDMLESRLINQNLNLQAKFELIKEIESLKHQPNSKTTLLNSLYFDITNEKNLDAKLVEDIFEYVNAIDVNEETPTDDYISTLACNNLFSNDEFLKVSILIQTCSKESFANFKISLEQYLEADKSDAKAAMSAHIQYLWFFDKKWTSGRLKKIFSNEIDGYNLSFHAFSFSLLYEVNFVHDLFNQGILEKLLNSNGFKSIAWKYAYLLMRNFIYSNEIIDVINVIANTSFYHNSLTLLIDYINRTKREKFNKEKFDKMLEVFMFKGNKNENIFHCGIDLIKFLNADEINSVDENFILFTFSHSNSSFYCEKLSNIIKVKSLNYHVSDEFIKEFLVHLKDCFYNEDKIKNLFNMIQDKDTKTIVLNALGNINPSLLTILKV
ncbi:uncharacterized protein BN742_01340 [Firmicutes bacterium CAG:631]|nr:uncharacterized protein BN742_01340 [Firmicutes bacterium CAG:631]